MITRLMICVLTVALASACQREATKKPQSLVDIASLSQQDADILVKKARAFDSLAAVVYDLSAELNTRTTSQLLPDFTAPPPPAGSQDIRLPEPFVPEVVRPTAEQLTRARAAAAPATLRAVSVAYSQDDLTQHAAALQDIGFTLQRIPAANADDSTNTLVFGDSVPLGTVRLLALELRARRIPLARIRMAGDSGRSRIYLTNKNHAETIAPLSPAQITAFVRPKGQ